MGQKILIERGGVLEKIDGGDLSPITGALFVPQLDFVEFRLMRDVLEGSAKRHKKGDLSREQLWFGAYFRTEILSFPVPDISLRYIDPVVGWGVFAERDFEKMEFIAEYSGQVRKRKRSDKKNAYCFEYLLVSGESSAYTIDARDQGGVGRYLNHSGTPLKFATISLPRVHCRRPGVGTTPAIVRIPGTGIW